MIRYIVIIFLVLFAISPYAKGGIIADSSNQKSQDTSSRATSQFHGIQQGFDMRIWMGNNSCMGENYSGAGATPNGFGLEYPQGRHIEHLFGAAPWIGALIDTGTPPRRIKAVTTGYEGWSGPFFEMHGNPDGSDSFFVTSIDEPNGHNKRGYDDDHDRKIDEDELDGIDNDGDGLIDEDYGAVSDRDVYVGYSDYYGDPNPIPGHVPLGLRVWQKSYCWSHGILGGPIIILDYYLTNTNATKQWDNVYVGMFVDADVGPTYVRGFYSHNYSAYDPFSHTAYADNPQDRPSTPLGVSLLGTSKPLDSLKYTFQWYPGIQAPPNSVSRYDLMSLGIIKPDEYPSLSDTRFLFSVGPFQVAARETLHITYALVSGNGVNVYPNSMLNNAALAQALYNRGYTLPPAPPSPPLRISKEYNRVKIAWKWKLGDPGIDPLEAWDDSNSFLSTLPDTDWRRKTPPAGHLRGGRIFEGFRIYRSESTSYDSTKFVLLNQYDVKDDLNIPYQTGLQYTYVDSQLTPEKTYWYAVTSYAIPFLGNQYSNDAPESNISDNATSITLAHEFRLYQAYPNPFNPRTTIEYDLAMPSHVSLIVYDVLGREVARLVDGLQIVGRYEVQWDASRFASGVYFYQLRAGYFVDVKKMLVLR